MFGDKTKGLLRKKALQAISQGKFPEAEARLAEVMEVTEARIARGGDDPRDYLNLGLAQIHLGRVQRTRDELRKGLPAEAAMVSPASAYGDLDLNLEGLENLLHSIRLCLGPVRFTEAIALIITTAGTTAAQVLAVLEQSAAISGDLDGDVPKERFPEPRRKALTLLYLLHVLALNDRRVLRYMEQDRDQLDRILAGCSPELLVAARQGKSDDEFNYQIERTMAEAASAEQDFVNSLGELAVPMAG